MQRERNVESIILFIKTWEIIPWSVLYILSYDNSIFWLHIDANLRSHIQTKTKLLTKYLPRRKACCLYQVPCYRWFHYHHCLQLQVRNINCLEHHTWCLLCYLGCFITHTHAFTYWRTMEIYCWWFLHKVEYTKLLGCNWWQTCKYSSPSKFWITVLQL